MQEQEFYLELYKETEKAVSIYWDKFFTVRYSCTKEDVVQSLMLKAVKPDRYGLSLYEKYREGKIVGGIRSLSLVNAFRFMTDLVRTRKKIISTETELADGLTIMDTISDNTQSFDQALINILERIPQDLVDNRLMWNNGDPVYIREIIYRMACGEKTTEICKDLSFRPKSIPVPSKVSSTIVYNIVQGCRPLFNDVLGEREVRSKGRA